MLIRKLGSVLGLPTFNFDAGFAGRATVTASTEDIEAIRDIEAILNLRLVILSEWVCGWW